MRHGALSAQSYMMPCSASRYSLYRSKTNPGGIYIPGPSVTDLYPGIYHANLFSAQPGLQRTLEAAQHKGLAAIPVIFSQLGMGMQDLTCTLLRPESEALVRIWGPPAS